MRLPNAENAFIDPRKLTEYALDPTNIRGRHKARVMQAVLGFTAENANQLRAIILNAVLVNDCSTGELDFYGQRYSVDCKIKTEKGEACAAGPTRDGTASGTCVQCSGVCPGVYWFGSCWLFVSFIASQVVLCCVLLHVLGVLVV